MANITNTILDTSGFVPQTWALRALDVLRSRIVLAKYIAKDTDFSEGGWQGKTLNIPYPGTFAAVDKVANTPVTAQAPTGGATVSLTLTKHKVVDFLVEDFGAAQANSDALARFVDPAVIAIAEQLELDLWTMYTSLTGTSVGTAGTDLVSGVLRTARKILNDNKAPMDDRHLVMSDKDEISLLGDTNLATYYAYSNPGSITQGTLPNLYGFQPHVSQLVTVVANAPNSTKNLAFHRNAMMFAMRPFKDIPAGSGVSTATIIDDQSGIAIRVVKQYKAEYRAEYVGFDVLYGFTVLRPNQGLVALG
jgi:hypothetical protein